MSVTAQGVEVVTLGCRLNIAESETIRTMLTGERDLVVVNSCAVTNEAVVATRKAIRRAARARPGARIVVTGCASEVDRAAFEGMAEVSHVVANTAKLDAALYRTPARAGVQGYGEVSPDPLGAPSAASGMDGTPLPWAPAFAGARWEGRADGALARHARAFVAVQNGCDHACTFCIIPQGRGASRSLPAGGVIDAVRAAVAAGQNEVVLTGVDLTAYGADLPGRPTLGHLVERILRLVPDLPRLRLSSLDPCDVDDRLAGLFASEARLMPHVHLSLQAGHDLILKRMKRRHRAVDAVRLVERLKAARPGMVVGADLIAGFPTEDEAMFADTLAALDACDVVHPHIFPFSPRAGTPAARMPQVRPDIVRERAARLRARAATRRGEWLRGRIGTTASVLVERDGLTGHDEGFAPVAIAGGVPGAIVRARITAFRGDELVGVAC